MPFRCVRLKAQLVRRDRRAVDIDIDRLVDGRESALRAVFPGAGPTPWTDGGGCVEIGEVKALRIDRAVGMAGLAA